MEFVEFETQQFQEALLHGQQLMKLVAIGSEVETLRLLHGCRTGAPLYSVIKSKFHSCCMPPSACHVSVSFCRT
jgi:hypothetical protein